MPGGGGLVDHIADPEPRRASPLPPPPADVGGGAINLNVPVRFSR